MKNQETSTSYWIYPSILIICSILLLFWIDSKKYEIEILWAGTFLIYAITIPLYIRGRLIKKLRLDSSNLITTLLSIYASSWLFFYATFEMYPKTAKFISSIFIMENGTNQAYSFFIANLITFILAVVELVLTNKKDRVKLNGYFPIIIINIIFIFSYTFLCVSKFILDITDK